MIRSFLREVDRLWNLFRTSELGILDFAKLVFLLYPVLPAIC